MTTRLYQGAKASDTIVLDRGIRSELKRIIQKEIASFHASKCLFIHQSIRPIIRLNPVLFNQNPFAIILIEDKTGHQPVSFQGRSSLAVGLVAVEQKAWKLNLYDQCFSEPAFSDLKPIVQTVDITVGITRYAKMIESHVI